MPYRDPAMHTEWCKTGRERVTVTLMKSTDADIIEWLKDKPSKSGVIKDVIRKVMESEKPCEGS